MIFAYCKAFCVSRMIFKSVCFSKVQGMLSIMKVTYFIPSGIEYMHAPQKSSSQIIDDEADE